jgi:flagellar motor component MotA
VRDTLTVERLNGAMVIRDSRPVATYPELSVTGMAARIYEYCDKAQTLARIVEVMKESSEEGVTEEQVSRILDEFINRKLMVQEGNRFLSLAVMTYTTEFERQESERAEARANRPIEALPQLVQLQPMMAR